MTPSNKKLDLRKNYSLILEFALIAALLIFITAVKFHIPEKSSSTSQNFIADDTPIIMSPITVHKKTPPPPVLSRIPAPIPDDSPLDPPEIEFGDFEDLSPIQALPPDDKPGDETEIIEIAEFMPKIKGGLKALYSNISYPETARRIGIEGMVVVQFVVNEQGRVVSPEIIRGIGAGCDEEVLQALKKVTFTPGVQNGKLVKVRMKQVIHFRLEK